MKWDQLHDEDILFEFTGNHANQLTPGRFYRGVVDGFAEFGVFVDIGSGVTGLLHRSQLPRRLESLDWDVGDEVIVQVTDVRDNGNVDLAWSLRQTPREFRGKAVDDPTQDTPSVEVPTGSSNDKEPEESEPPQPEPDVPSEPATEEVASLSRTHIGDVEDQVGNPVHIEGQVQDIRQTSGPTIFEIADESGSIHCAAFEAPGVRAYPTVESNDVVQVTGVVERHRDAVQIEVEVLEILDDPERSTIIERLDEAVTAQAAPTETTLMVETPQIDAITDALATAATTLRRAAIEAQRVIIRHPTTVDGYVGAAAVERAVRLAIEAEHAESRAAARLVTRRPIQESWYELGDAFFDVPRDPEEEPPLVVVVGAGGSTEDEDALEFLGLYDIERVVIDTIEGEGSPAEHVLIPRAGDHWTTATAVAVNLAGLTEPAVRAEIAHLPAISYWDSTPEPYAAIAADHGFDPETVRKRREAIALIAYYQRYDDKRELVTDLLFDGDQAGELATHVSKQYREKVETAVRIAEANREEFSVRGGRVTLIDTEDMHHPREFPPIPLLLGALRSAWEPAEDHVIVAIGADTCYIDGSGLDLESLANQLDAAVDQAGVDARRDRLTFLAGKRDEIRAALVDAFASAFDAPSTR